MWIGISTAPEEQLHIPMFIWASDIFLKDEQNMEMFKNAYLKKDYSIDQGYIFHSVLDCAKVKSNAIDLHQSICANINISNSMK